MTDPRPKLLIFASGSKDGGGSGFENLVKANKNGKLNADIVAVVSNHEFGGVREKADRLGIPFLYFGPPWTADRYKELFQITGAEFTALSGWLKFVCGLDPRTTFNIHPGPLPAFGGPGMYGHHVHEAVYQAYRRGEITSTEICMHFVTSNEYGDKSDYDRGPVFFRFDMKLYPDNIPKSIAARANRMEHVFQPIITDLVVNGFISWDGKDPESLKFPKHYTSY